MEDIANPVTIMLVDDHPLFRRGLRTLIDQRSDLAVVAETGTGEDAAALYAAHRPDIVLMDIKLPGIDGIDAMRQIHAINPDARVIMLSATDFSAQILESINAGAAGYLVKNLEPEELFSTIDTVARTGFCLSKAHLDQIVHLTSSAKTSEPKHSKPLSARELEIINLVATGKTNKEIAEALFITPNTVKAHISNIMDKLGVHNRVALTTYALGHTEN